MAVDHSRDDANAALDERASRQNAMAQHLVEQAQLGPEETARLEEERQAAYRYFQDTGNDFLDLSPAAQKAYLKTGTAQLTADEAQENPHIEINSNDPSSLQARLDEALNFAVQEAAPEQWTRGGTTVLRWGIMQDDDSDDYTLGVSVAYNTQEPADVYLAVTQQRLNEWRSLQGKDGEKRFAMGLVSHLVNLTGEDIAVEIASALGELVAVDGSTTSFDGPTETAIGPDYDGDDALTDEDGS
jgi:hypothetical protein